MTGLLIAAGDSPDALTNITRGLAQGFKMYGDALDDEKEKDNTINKHKISYSSRRICKRKNV